MKQTMLFIAILLVTTACKKDKPHTPEKEKSRLELLTEKKWVLRSYGWDDNKNNKVDPAEDMSRECERDNTFEFFKDVTGVSKDNENTCDNGVPVTNFNWQFNTDSTGITISQNSVTFGLLTKDSLILQYHIQGLIDGFIGVYTLKK